MSDHKSIRMSLNFLADDQLRVLQSFAREDAPVVLGRVVTLACVISAQRRVKFHVGEIDTITAWRGVEPFAVLLEKVGWAKRHEDDKLTFTISMPETVQALSLPVLAGQARARGAKRDSTGRYVKKAAEAQPQHKEASRTQERKSSAHVLVVPPPPVEESAPTYIERVEHVKDPNAEPPHPKAAMDEKLPAEEPKGEDLVLKAEMPTSQQARKAKPDLPPIPEPPKREAPKVQRSGATKGPDKRAKPRLTVDAEGNIVTE